MAFPGGGGGGGGGARGAIAAVGNTLDFTSLPRLWRGFKSASQHVQNSIDTTQKLQYPNAAMIYEGLLNSLQHVCIN